MPDHAATLPVSATRGLEPGSSNSLPAWTAELGLVALLGAELFVLSVAFDTGHLDAVPSVWARLVGWTPAATRLAIAISLAICLLDGRRLLAGLRTARRLGRRSQLSALAIHLAAIAAFTVTTSMLVNGNVASLSDRPLWTAAWLAAGVTSMLAWGMALFPLDIWRTVVRPQPLAGTMGALVGAAVWASGFVTQQFWAPMARVTFRLVAWMLALVYHETVADPARLIVGTRSFKVLITPQCSGYEGIGLVVTFLAAYLCLFRKSLRFPAVLVLIPIGAVTIWVVNALRIAALVAIGTAGWPAVAAGGFHSQAGWIAFNIIAIGFVALSSRVQWFQATPQQATAAPRRADSTVALLMPFTALTGAAMVTAAFSAGFDWLYPLRVVAAGAVLWIYRHEYASLLRMRSWSWWPLVIGAATFVTWLALVPVTAHATDGWPAALRSAPLMWAATWMVLRVIGSVVVTPLAEELAFRAYLTRRLATTEDVDCLPVGYFSWFSFLASSVLFGALHGRMWVAATAAGMAFALALYRRRAFGDAVVAHAIANGLLAAYASTTGHWSVWS